MLHRFDRLAVWALVLVGSALPDQLLARFWMLALAKALKISGRDGSGEAESAGELALPLAPDFTFLRPVILLFCGELLRMVGLRLAGRKRFRNG